MVADGQHAVHGLYAACRAQQVPGHGFGGADHQFLRMFAENGFGGVGFVGIAQRRGSAVRVHIINRFHRQAAVFNRAGQCQRRAFRIRRGDVVCVRAGAETGQFRINSRTAAFCMFQFFQYQDARTFAHHKTVAVFVPRAGSGCRVVVACGQGLHGRKTAHTQRAHRAFRAAGNHHIHIAVFNQPRRFADGMRAGSTRRHDAVIVAAIAFQNGNMAGNQIDQTARNEKRIDFSCTARHHITRRFLNQRQTADSGADIHTDAVFVQFGKFVQPRIFDGLQSAGNTVMDKRIHTARFFGRQILRYIKIFHFTCNLARHIGRIEFGNSANAAFAGQ